MSGSLGGVDASIPLQAGKGVQQPNPLQTIGQFAQIQNALNQNKLFPGQQTLQQQAIQSGQTNLTNLNNASAYRAAAPLLAGGPITHDSLTTALGSIEQNLGISTHQIVNDVLATAPSGDGPEFDARVRALIASRSQTSPESAVGMVTPHAGTIDTGPAIQPVNIAPAGAAVPGTVTPVGGAFAKGIGPQFVNNGAGAVPTNNGVPTGAAPITNQLSPAQLATPTQIGMDDKGAPIMGTLGQFLSKTGGASPLGTGRFPDALRNPANPTPTGAPGTAPGDGVVTGLGPAAAAAQSATGADSAHGFQDITNQGVQARNQSAVLGNMLAEAQQFTPGPTKLNEFNKTLQRYAPNIAAAIGVDPKSVAANESFDKLSAQIADAQGAGSDARLAVIQHANPGSQLSPGGADQIIRQLQGNADYLRARSDLAAGYPDKSDRAGFEKQIGSNLDPRAFQFSRMTPQQKADYAKSLSAPDLAKVKSSYNWGVQHGLIGGADAG